MTWVTLPVLTRPRGMLVTLPVVALMTGPVGMAAKDWWLARVMLVTLPVVMLMTGPVVMAAKGWWLACVMLVTLSVVALAATAIASALQAVQNPARLLPVRCSLKYLQTAPLPCRTAWC